MHEGNVGRLWPCKEEQKPLVKLLGEPQRDALAAENDQVGEACSTSKYFLIWELNV